MPGLTSGTPFGAPGAASPAGAGAVPLAADDAGVAAASGAGALHPASAAIADATIIPNMILCAFFIKPLLLCVPFSHDVRHTAANNYFRRNQFPVSGGNRFPDAP